VVLSWIFGVIYVIYCTKHLYKEFWDKTSDLVRL